MREQGVLVLPAHWRPASPSQRVRGGDFAALHRRLDRGQTREPVALRPAQSESQRRCGLQRLVEGHVEVHGSGGRTHRVPGRTADQLDHRPRARLFQRLGRGQGQIRLVTHAIPEDAGLRDGLVGIRPAQTGRPVRGDHDEGDIGQISLDDRGEEVRDRGPGGGQDCGRAQMTAPVSNRKEPGRTLVQVHPAVDVGQGTSCQHEGRGPGTGGDLHLFQAVFGEGAKDRTGPRKIEFAAGHPTVTPGRPRRSRPPLPARPPAGPDRT